MFLEDISVIKHLKMKQSKNHIYIAPHPLLTKYIAHYTISFPNKHKIIKDTNNSDLIIIPDGSGCMVFTYEDNNLSSSLWGATTKTVAVKKDINSEKIRFFIEFMPGGLRAITGIKQSELSDVKVPIDEIDKSLENFLIQAIENSKNIDDMISMVNLIFLKAIDRNNKEHSVIDSALHKIKYLNSGLTIKELSVSECISERHLHRLFNEYIGINAKMFIRLARINNSIKLLKKINSENCLDITYSLGFYDQSHFINDFKQICGVSPKVFIKNMSDFYNEQFKY